MNLCQPCFFCFSLYTLQLHFKIPLEFYACDWITTLSEQQHSQTLTNRFFAFSMLICSWASSYTENHSCKWPAPEMETFFTFQGCPHRVSTVVIVMATNKERKQQGRRRSKRILVNGKMETKYKLKQSLCQLLCCNLYFVKCVNRSH